MEQDFKNLLDPQDKVEFYNTVTINSYFGDIRFVIDHTLNMKNETWEIFEGAGV